MVNPPESKSIPRGVLWLVLGVAFITISAMANLAATLVNQRIDALDKRGSVNQDRIAVLEAKYSSIDAKQDYTIELLKRHMDESK